MRRGVPRWRRRASPIWSRWRSSWWPSAVGAASASPSWRGAPACRWPGSTPSCPTAAPSCAASAVGSTRRCSTCELAELDGMTPRERVFELVMRRLDAMAPYKDGLRTIAREAPRDPALLVAAWCNVGRLSRRLLDAAGTADAARHRRRGPSSDRSDLRPHLPGLARRRNPGHGCARWPSSTEGCSRPSRSPAGYTGSAASVPVMHRRRQPRPRLEVQRNRTFLNWRTIIAQRTVGLPGL